MRVLVTLVVILGAVVCCQAKRARGGLVVRDAQMKMTNAEAVTFIKGLAAGFEVALGDPAKCSRELPELKATFASSFSDLERGIDTKSIPAAKRGLLELAKGLVLVAEAFEDCGVIKAAKDIAWIYTNLQEGNLVSVALSQSLNIFSHGNSLVSLVHHGSSSWNSQNFYQAGKAVGNILGILIDAEHKK